MAAANPATRPSSIEESISQVDDELKQIIERGIAQGLSDEDIRLVAQAYQSQQKPVEPPVSPEQRREDWLRSTDFVKGQPRSLSDLTPLDVGLMALPPVVAGAARFGGPLLRAGATHVANALEQPLIAGGIGAVEGYRQGGIPGALIGMITGGAASRFAKNLRPGEKPPTPEAELGLARPEAAAARQASSVVDGPARVDRVRGQGAPAIVAPLPPPAPKPMRSSVRKTDGPESAGMRDAGREGRRSYEDKAASDRMVRGMSTGRTQPAATPAPTTPTTTTPQSVPASKSKRPTYTENDLKAAKEKWGSTDIADLRTTHGQAVDDYLLAKRAERHQQHYNTNRELAAARRTDLDPLGATSELPSDVRKMLLDTLKQRGGK